MIGFAYSDGRLPAGREIAGASVWLSGILIMFRSQPGRWNLQRGHLEQERWSRVSTSTSPPVADCTKMNTRTKEAVRKPGSCPHRRHPQTTDCSSRDHTPPDSRRAYHASGRIFTIDISKYDGRIFQVDGRTGRISSSVFKGREGRPSRGECYTG